MQISLRSICLLVLTLPWLQAQAQDNAYGRFYRAIRSDNLAELRRMLESGQSPNVSGSQKMTPLLDAAIIGSSQAMKLLLEHGAGVDAQNEFGRTALMYAGGDREKVQLLLDRDADVKRMGAGVPPFGGETFALLEASRRPGSVAVVRSLLAKGADVRLADSNGIAALHVAAITGDLETLSLLIDHGADVNAPALSSAAITPLMGAALSRQPAAVRLLLAKGARVNMSSPIGKAPEVKNGFIDIGGESALHFAAPYGPPEVVKILLDAGADPNAKDVRGMTPLMWAVASEYQNPEIVRLLLARGADAKIKSRDGDTALDLAKRLGASGGIFALGGAATKPGAAALKNAGAPDPRTALLRGLGMLDRTASSSFLQSGGCVACHAQMGAQLAGASAMRAGIHSDENTKRLQILKPGLEIAALQGASGEAMLYTLEAFRSLKDVPERSLDYAAAALAAAQTEDGSWHSAVPRAPMQDGDFTQTALSVRALVRYAPPSMQPAVALQVKKTRQWLLAAKPVSAESAAMRLLGLAATAAGTSDVRKAAGELLRAQRSDGGWAQRPELASDAYATGMALWALAEAGQLQTQDAAYQKGIRFLIGTQAADGSWHVKSRAVIRFQPYFDSGFPYEHDQWISSMATAWAAKALSLAVSERMHAGGAQGK